MNISFSLNFELPAKPINVYTTWMSIKGHAEMTRASAKIENTIGAKFSAWDGYIFGENIELKEGTYIKQSWRTTEFQETDPDSILEIFFEKINSGCKVKLIHSNIPEKSA